MERRPAEERIKAVAKVRRELEGSCERFAQGRGEQGAPERVQRLADQLAELLDAEAADCYLLDRERGLFRCVAVPATTSTGGKGAVITGCVRR